VSLYLGIANSAFADCVLAEEVKLLDPVEVGFCESDAVFVAESAGAIESYGGVTDPESGTTKHFRIQRSTLRILDQHKGKLPDKVILVADLYAKEGAFEFEYGKQYLVFAKRLAGENEFVSAAAQCSVQPTLHIEDAGEALKQLALHKQGTQKIDCKNMRKKPKK
jgi:hypothetical protein